MDKKHGVGRAEVEVLRFVADRPGVAVSTVAEHLSATKGQTRTTALNTMERLRKKGFLRREKLDGVYKYFPAGGKVRLFEGLVDDFVETVLGGSVTPLVAYLTQKVDADDAQLGELRKLLEKLEGDEHVS
ncbi:MAG: BlaI/MecI/CopY family transcriptional regulator [Fimbriimonas sp.]|nr:BlaI/MecI/CopY family transcriptional regulator [Fimbriimonas sp.]